MKRTISQVYSTGQIHTSINNNNAIIIDTIKSMKRQKKIAKSIGGQGFYMRYKSGIKKSIGLVRESLCKICQNSFGNQELYAFCHCLHKFCEQCGHSYLTYKINAFEKIKCPQDECSAGIDKESYLFTTLAKQLQQKFKKFQHFELTRDNPNLKLCPVDNCQGILNISLPQIQCNVCKKIFCNKCLYVKHEGQCTNFQVDFLQNNYKFRQCQKCKNVIQKNQGCNHITCRCGYQFCYVCGADWSKDPCRFPNQVPPPPPEPQSDCERCCRIGMKIFTIPLWLIFGLIIVFIPMFTFTIALFLIALVFGSFEYFCDLFSENDGFCCGCLIFLGMPFILFAGIFVFLYKNGQEIRQCYSDCSSCYVETLQGLIND